MERNLEIISENVQFSMMHTKILMGFIIVTANPHWLFQLLADPRMKKQQQQ